MHTERGMYNMRKQIRKWFRELLEIIFQASALVIDTVRTFFLIVLSILGPVAFAISIYDGFSSTLTQWISRYVSVYLWLPVSDLFSSILARIQILILRNDIEQLQNNPGFSIDATSTVYIIFLLIGIVGYFTIPGVANWVITAGGMSGYNRNLTNTATKSGALAGAAGGAVAGNISGRLLRRRKN
jgi:conjugative transposon TraJ protein